MLYEVITISIAGGKWTTYRKMGEDVIEQAIVLGDLPTHPSKTETLKIHGYHQDTNTLGHLNFYGSDASLLNRLIDANRNNFV